MTTTAQRPATMPLNPAGLPDDPLLQLPQFVVWGWTWSADKGKWDKPPTRARDGYAASVTASKDWATLEEAIPAVARLGLDGIGIVLTGTEGVTGIDLDKCRDRATGAIDAWAQTIIARFGSYWEPSASGTGIRIFVRATLPPGRRRVGQIEMYDSGRYLTINGNPGTGASRHFERRQAELDAWHAELFPAPAPTPVHRGHPLSSADDSAVLDRARAATNGAKFSRLYDAGDWQGDYASRSEARAALCSLIGFWVNRDPTRIERLFETSPLYDEKKWPRERDNVLKLAGQGEAFDWADDARRPVSTLDIPSASGDDALADYLAMPHHDLAQLAAERGRRLDAIDELLTCPAMTEVEKVTAYIVVKAAAVAQARQPEDAPTRELVVNQKAMACDIGLSRQTIGKKIAQWSEQGYLRKEARGTGQFTKKGGEIRETVIQLPARTFTDNLVMASTWHRPPDAPKQGGNGHRCPACNSTATRKKTESARVEITTISCADCGTVISEQTGAPTHRKTIETSYPAEQRDVSTDVGAVIIAARRRSVASVDTPPVPEVTTTPPVEDVVNLGTPPRAWVPVSCTDCYAEGRAPAGEIWTCLRCQRARSETYAHTGD